MQRCSTCDLNHYPPLGRRCAIVKMSCVEGSGFTDRKDEEYLKFLEDKFLESTKSPEATAGAGADPALAAILKRLDKLESGRDQSAGHGDGSHTGRPANPSPSDLANLSDSIHQLSLSVHSEPPPQKSGTELRPEYYVQVIAKGGTVRNMSCMNLRSEELMYGMCSVYDYLLSSGGDAAAYFKHLMFVARHLMERNFTVSACCKYDKYVVDQVLDKKGSFAAIDPIAAGLFLHGGAVVRNEPPRQQFGSYTSRPPLQGKFQNLRECNRENTPGFMPENWPQEICFSFNAKTCYGRCNKNHICGYCRLKHRLADCKFAVSQVQDQSRT